MKQELGLAASLLAGRIAELPQLDYGPGQPAENRDLTALIAFCVTSPTGGSAIPVFS